MSGKVAQLSKAHLENGDSGSTYSEHSCEGCVNSGMQGTWHSAWHGVRAQLMVALALTAVPHHTHFVSGIQNLDLGLESTGD